MEGQLQWKQKDMFRQQKTLGQSGIPAKHNERWKWGSWKSLEPQYNLQELGYHLSSIIEAEGGLEFQGHPSSYNVGGKTWTGYDSCKYDNSAVDYSYMSVPFIYQTWCCSYGQDNMAPYYGLYRLWLWSKEVWNSGFVSVDNNLGLGGNHRLGLLWGNDIFIAVCTKFVNQCVSQQTHTVTFILSIQKRLNKFRIYYFTQHFIT